jgi:hypothetical protein
MLPMTLCSNKMKIIFLLAIVLFWITRQSLSFGKAPTTFINPYLQFFMNQSFTLILLFILLCYFRFNKKIFIFLLLAISTLYAIDFFILMNGRLSSYVPNAVYVFLSSTIIAILCIIELWRIKNNNKNYQKSIFD